MVLLALLFSSIFPSISTETPWYSHLLETHSPNYIPQLYCGTVARGRISIAENRNEFPTDPTGFAQGVEEIIRISQIHSQPTFLNDDELSWLRQETWSLLGDNILGKNPSMKGSILKMLFSLLLSLKTNRIKTITLASLLEKAKKHQIIFDPQVKFKAIDYLQKLPQSPDKLCENLRESLIKFVQSPFLIPNLTTQEDFKKALKRSLSFFPDNMKDKDLMIFGYYAYAEYAEYEKTESLASMTRFLTVIEILCDKYRINFYNIHVPGHISTARGPRVTLALILNAVRSKGEYLYRKAGELFESLSLHQDDITEYEERSGKAHSYESRFDPLPSLAQHLLRLRSTRNDKLLKAITENPKLVILCPAMEKLLSLIKAKFKEDKEKE
jgi:hypothetical protein